VKAGRLRRSDCSGRGIGRRRRGSGFSYLDPEGGAIRDEDTLERIRELAIPPAWREVWICSDPYGHIQATGLDEAGRKQYLYHERWQLRAAQRKFESMREFAAILPKLRRAVKKDLALEGMPRERALACAVRLLDLGFFRIGGEEYAETNESYGVATVLREHVSIEGEEVVFDFPAKSGQRRVQSIRDPEVKAVIEAMRRRRSGPDDLLVYRDGQLARRPLRRRQHIPAGEGRRGVFGQGLPHLARDRARRGRAGARGAAGHQGRGRGGDPCRGQTGRRAPRQHPRGLPQLLH